MSGVALKDFHETVNSEIKEYEEIEELYKLKQAILIAGKSDALWDIDAKITDKISKINRVSAKRREFAKYLGSENMTMSDVIKKAEFSDLAIAKKLNEQKSKLNLLASSISLYQKTNMELIKHGLIMTEKTMGIIVSAVTPPPNQYDKSGKNVGNEKVRISSIIEEA